MFDFPQSPASGTQVTNGSVTYRYDGAKWTSTPVPMTAYAPVNSPTFTGDPQAPTPSAGDADASIATTAFVAPSWNNVGRNLLHNGQFNVQQRGAGPFSVAYAYTADRWRNGRDGGDTSTVTIVALSAANITAIGDEAARYGAQIVVTGSATTGSDTSFYQSIEDVRRLAGKTVTVSFWAWASATLKVGVSWWQVFGSGGSAAVNGVGQAVTVSTTPTRYSVTLTFPSVAGKTFGSGGDDNTSVVLVMSASTDQNSWSGSVGVQSGTFTFWGVQLEIGSVATPLAKRDPADELALCQRFYQVGATMMTTAGITDQWISYYIMLPVAMRAAPTVGFFNTSYYQATGINASALAWSGFNVYAAASTNGLTQFTSNYTASADL